MIRTLDPHRNRPGAQERSGRIFGSWTSSPSCIKFKSLSAHTKSKKDKRESSFTYEHSTELYIYDTVQSDLTLEKVEGQAYVLVMESI